MVNGRELAYQVAMEVTDYLTNVLGLKRVFVATPAKSANSPAPSSQIRNPVRKVAWLVNETKTNEAEALVTKIIASLNFSKPIQVLWKNDLADTNELSVVVRMEMLNDLEYGKNIGNEVIVPSPMLMLNSSAQEVNEYKKLCWGLLKSWKDEYESK